MKKIFLQIFILVAVFFSVWFALSCVNWMSIFQVEKISRKTEEKLGSLVWDYYKDAKTEINDKNITQPVDSLIRVICEQNHIPTDRIKLHILKIEEINAFALPDQHLVINSGLIESCKNEAELSGVIAHELVHMQSRHVMKKLVSEMGLSFLLSVSSGGLGSDAIKETVQLISSTAYDRKLEKEADTKAVDYLVRASINPFPFATFMERIAEKEKDNPYDFKWLSTHPESLQRAKYIKSYAQKFPKSFKPVLSTSTWNQLLTDLKVNY